MASKAKKSAAEDAPLIDLNGSSIKKLITKAKKRGYITIDELNEALPQDQNEQIEAKNKESHREQVKQSTRCFTSYAQTLYKSHD